MKNKDMAKKLLKIAEELVNPHYIDPRLVKQKDKMIGETELDSMKAVGKKKFDEYHK